MTAAPTANPTKPSNHKQLNQHNQDTSKATLPTHNQGRNTSRTPRPRTAQIGQTRPWFRPPPPQPAQLYQFVERPLHPTAIKPDRCSAKIEHHSSSKPPDPKTSAPPLTAGSRSRKKTPIRSPRWQITSTTHTNSSKSFRQLIERGTSSPKAPLLCPEHNPHRRGREGEIEEEKSKTPYQPSRL
ncbi:hypothetical protein ACOSP7_005576 [Xanthoceras sorbifolium]